MLGETLPIIVCLDSRSDSDVSPTEHASQPYEYPHTRRSNTLVNLNFDSNRNKVEYGNCKPRFVHLRSRTDHRYGAGKIAQMFVISHHLDIQE